MSLRIQQADERQLLEMVRLRNLEEGDEKGMRAALYAYYNLSEPVVLTQKKTDTEGKGYELTVLNADELTTDADSSLVFLLGNVRVSFSLDDEVATLLSADRMIVDRQHSLLSAEGNVTYEDPKTDAALQKLEGTIVTFRWSDSVLQVSGATTSSEKTNSEDETVTLYTKGSLITYEPDIGLLYENGVIGTRKTDPLSSIHASRFSFLPGGDLVVHDALLYLGRVPVFWTPFFFFPSNRMVGNPSFGFSSERGMFVSTTFELYGNYPGMEAGKQTSFTRLLSTTGEKDLSPDKVLYSNEKELSPIEVWARQSGSYLTVMADAYEIAGLSMAVDCYTSLYEKKLVIQSMGALALYPSGTEEVSTYSGVPRYRYYALQSIAFKNNNVNISLELPFYSDPKVKTLYANRLTSFSFDAVLGKTQEFPTTYTGDITSYRALLEASLTLPVRSISPYISRFSISQFKSEATWKWMEVDNTYAYVLTKVQAPSLQANVEGTLFSFESSYENEPGKAEKENEGELSVEDPLLPSLKTEASGSLSQTRTNDTQKYSLTYSIQETLEHSLDADGSALDWDEDTYLSTLTKGSFDLSIIPHSRYFTFNQQVLPQLSSVEDQSKDTFLNQQLQLFSTTKASLPFAGLSYTLSQRLYHHQDTYAMSTDGSETVLKESESQEYQFDDESVTVHQLRLERSLSLSLGTLTASFTSSLYPLTQRLTPLLAYKQGNLSMSSSFTWSEQDDVLAKDNLTVLVQYSSQMFTFKCNQTYDLTRNLSNWTDSMKLVGSSTVKLFGKNLSISENFTFHMLDTDGVEHKFDELSFSMQVPFASIQYSVDGPIDDLDPLKLTVKLNAKDLTLYLYKRRIALSCKLDSTLQFYFQDRYASYFEIEASFGLSIAQFLDVELSVVSSNTGFFHYYDDDDKFSFALLNEDLIRSFDFFGTGRTNTQFNLSSISLELTHYLQDWSLNCKYSGSVVLSNNQYSWVPSISVFLQWDTIPELDVTEKWTKNADVWTRSVTT